MMYPIKICKRLVETCLDSYLVPRSTSLQNFIDHRNNHFGKYDLIRGEHNVTINQVFGEYRFYDIQKNDIILDIGSHIGTFSMFVSQSADHIFAVEPLFTDILRSNIENNGIVNIEILDIGLGDGWLDCVFLDRKKRIECKSLSEIIQMCGGHVDFLKCDCEGGEWCIKPEELDGIRRIEAEIHSFNGEELTDFSRMLENEGYSVSITDRSDTTMMIHASKTRPAEEVG